MQIYIFTPLILITLAKWPKYALGVLCALAAAGIGVPFGISYGLDLQSSMAAGDRYNVLFQIDLSPKTIGRTQIKSSANSFICSRDNMANFMNYYYVQAYARFGPYVIGMIFGYAIYKIKQTESESTQWKKWVRMSLQ